MFNTNEIIDKLKLFKNPLIAWSGGKDSMLVSEVFRKLGSFKYAAVVSEALEYKMHLNFITSYLKKYKLNAEIIETGFNFEWLDKNPEFILPVNSKIRSKIYKLVQQNHIRKFAEKNKHDVVIFGRRTSDGNSIPKELYKTKNGIYQYFPFRDVNDEDVFKFLKGVELSPIYEKCEGFTRGTHTVNICNVYGDSPTGKRLEFVKLYEPEKYNKLQFLIKKHNINV